MATLDRMPKNTNRGRKHCRCFHVAGSANKEQTIMKMFVSAVFLATGLLVSTGSGWTQQQAEVPPERPADATTATESFVNLNLERFALNDRETAGSSLAKQQLVEAYDKLPLSFEANTGQTDSHVAFLSRGPGYTLLLTAGGATVLTSGKDKSLVAKMELTGANPAPEARGLDELSGKSYYMIGNDPDDWQNNVPSYTRVRYQAVYPGVDLVYYGHQRQLEYDFVVAPGADPKPIQLNFPDAERICIDPESGDLKLTCVGGEVRLHKPLAYQTGNGKSEVEARYVLTTEKQVGITVGSYDAAKPLIIDPVLTYSTYLGGSGLSAGYAIAIDSSGDVYVTGFTDSPDFPIVHPLPASNNTSPAAGPAFVTKLRFDRVTSTLSLVYSIYLGGKSGTSQGFGIAVDRSGNAYVTGITSSPDFPVAHPLPAPNNALQGFEDGFVSKLCFDRVTSTLSLVYSTYLGGSGNDYGYGIAIDSFGNAYVTGGTASSDFPTLHQLPSPNNALQGFEDGFVSKLTFDNSTLSLAYSTYLGGSGYDDGYGIAVDLKGNAYVSGTANSADFPLVHPLPAPNNVYRAYYNSAFVSKLSFDRMTSKLSLAYSTYLGGSVLDEGFGIAVDARGNAYVTGYTYSPDFPTAHPLPPPNNAFRGFEDAFVSKLSFDSLTSTLSLTYSTFLGSSSDDFGRDEGFAIAVDLNANAYVTGLTTSTVFPVVRPLPAPNNAFQGVEDAFVSKLSFDLVTATLSLAYSTYLGGDDSDWGFGIAVDAIGNAYVTGRTFSSNFPTEHPLSAPDNALEGTYQGFVVKLAANRETPPNLRHFLDHHALLPPPKNRLHDDPFEFARRRQTPIFSKFHFDQ
jgi:hypothetical protein